MPKTPDDVKKGLECVADEDGGCSTCPYRYEEECKVEATKDALALIQQLEAQNAEKDARIQQLESDKQQLEGMLHHMNQLRDAAAGRALKMEERVHQLEAERDALLKYLTESHFVPCDICKHDVNGSVMGCKRVREIKGPCFEWRGVTKEE